MSVEPAARPSSAPDPRDERLFPVLDERHLELIEQAGSPRELAPGEVLFEHGVRDAPFVVLTRGRLEFHDRGPDGDRYINDLLPGTFVGDLSIFTGEPTIAECRACSPSRVIVLDRPVLQELTAQHPDLGDLLLGTMALRREWLDGRGFGQTRVIAGRSSSEAFQIRDLLARNLIPHRWIDVAVEPEDASALAGLGLSDADAPVVVQGNDVLRRAVIDDVATRLGLRADVDGRCYDVAVVGAGPAGLAAAVYATSEGLDTVVFDAFAPGGQAGTSSRIENYLGFPTGIAGSDLARRAVLQARRFGATLSSVHPVTVVRRLPDGAEGRFALDLGDGQSASARSVVIATGARYRRLEADGVERFEGAGVYYAASHAEALHCSGDDVVVVGGANSAGQAALHLARFAATVHLVVRRTDLRETMSAYLVDRIEADPGVRVHRGTRITAFHGREDDPDTLRGVTLTDAADDEREVATGAVFVLIGGTAPTETVSGLVELDRGGFILTGLQAERRLTETGRTPERTPFLLETTAPGLFAIGDVRADSSKRVATAVGDGALAVRYLHGLLA